MPAIPNGIAEETLNMIDINHKGRLFFMSGLGIVNNRDPSGSSIDPSSFVMFSALKKLCTSEIRSFWKQMILDP